jgi:TP901 family phage tail tape measure protein
VAAPLALIWDLIAVDNASGTFTRVGAAAEGATGMIGKMAAALGAIAVIDIGVHMVKSAADFQAAMLLVQTQAGASAAEVKTMSSAVLGLAGEVATAPEALATSLYHVESVGLRGAAALDVVRIAAEGAKVGHADLEQTTNALTAAVASGIPGVQNMTQAMGALNTIVGSGDMKMQDLNEALGSGLLTVVKGYGLSLTDVGAALATFGDNNIRGADAATMLRMAVQAMAVPAKGGKDALDQLGLSATQLQKDMQQGGLNQAVTDLKTHIDAAGISGVEVGALLTDAFGKKAGPGVAVLLGQFDRLQTKYEDITKGAGGFDAAWQATTQNASFAFDKVRASVDVLAIRIGTALLPYVTTLATSVSDFLGNLGSSSAVAHFGDDIAAVFAVAKPLGQEFGAVLIPAVKLLVGVMEAAGSAIGTATGFLRDHAAIVQDVIAPIAAMWLVWKGYSIVSMAAAEVIAGINRIIAAVQGGAVSVAAASTVMELALGAVGLAVIAATVLWQRHAAQQAEAQRITESYTEAIKADSGAIGENTRTLAINDLQKAGAYTLAKQLGLAYDDVTQAALGNTEATGRIKVAQDNLNKSIDAYQSSNTNGFTSVTQLTDAQVKQRDALHALNVILGTESGALGAAKAAQEQLKSATEGTGSTTLSTADMIQTTTNAMNDEKSASDALKEALDGLDSANLSLDKAQTQTQVGIHGLAAAHAALAKSVAEGKTANDDDTGSLSQLTVVGEANRQVIQSRITDILAEVKAMEKNGESSDAVKGKVAELSGQLLDQAGSAGYNRDQVKEMIDKLLAVPAAAPPPIDITVRTSSAQAAVDALLGSLSQVAVLSAPGAVRGDMYLGAPVPHAGGGFLGDGWSTAGEGGVPELMFTSGGKTQVFSNSDSRNMLGAGNADMIAAIDRQTEALNAQAAALAQYQAEVYRQAAADSRLMVGAGERR